MASNVDVVYLDFAKAFDKVDEEVLLLKLRSLGISGRVGLWLCNFLKNRQQRVVVEGAFSRPETVVNGISQGSVLGLLLFIIMMGNIDWEIQISKLSSFVDDTKIKNSIKSVYDFQNLQQDLETVYEWANTNNVTFNSSEFEVIKYGPNRQLQEITTSGGEKLVEKSTLKNLGVWLSHDCTFRGHIMRTTKAGKHMMGWILHTFITRNPEGLLPL